MKRLLVVAVVVALALRLGPPLLAFVRPRLRATAARLQRRADLAAAVVMVAFAANMAAHGELFLAALVALIGAPAYAAAFSVVAAWWRGRG